jgi:hypothetical protein
MNRRQRTAPKPASETDYADQLKYQRGPAKQYFEDGHLLAMPVREEDPVVARAAALTVCDRALSRDDAVRLLAMLGLAG